MIATQYIKLNMVPSGYPPVLYMSQYDVGRPVGFVVSASGSTPDLDGYTVTLEGTRSDGTPVTAPVTTDGNICALETTATMTNKVDRYPAQIVVTDANENRIASIPVTMMVVKAAMNENAEGVEEDRSLYQQYTGTVQSLIADIRTQLNAEASDRQAADNQLQSNINAEASTRATTDASLQSQINQLVAPSGEAPSAAEVENARVGADGTVYPTLGDAIRTQVTDVKSAIDANQELIDADIKAAGYVTGLNFVPPLWETGGITSTGAYNTTGVRSKIFIPVVAGQDIVCINDHNLSAVQVAFYDAGFAFISRPAVSKTSPTVIPSNAAYARLASPNLTYGTTIKMGLAYASAAQEYQDYNLYSPTVVGLTNASPSLVESVVDLTSIMHEGEYIQASNGAIRSNSSFFYTDSIVLHKGEYVRVTAKGSGSAPAWISKWTAGGTFVETILTSTNTLTTYTYAATDDIEYIRFSNSKISQTYPFDVVKMALNVPEAFSTIVRDIVGTNPQKHTITVGTGKDFTSLVDAINSITDSSEDNQYVIKIYPGEYETVVESEITTGYKGLIVPDYVSIIGIGNRDSIIIKGNLPSASYAEYAGTISTLNLTMNGEVENVTIKAKNLRYCNHDDGTDATIPGSMTDVKHTFRRVKWVSELTDTGITVPAYCVGIGAQANKEVVLEDCVFVNENPSKCAVLIHDNAAASQVNGGRLYVRNCIFNLASGCDDVRLSNSGGNMESYAYLIGNAFSSGVLFTSANAEITTNVWKLFATGNKNYSLTKKSGMVNVDLSADITEFNNIVTA